VSHYINARRIIPDDAAHVNVDMFRRCEPASLRTLPHRAHSRMHRCHNLRALAERCRDALYRA
jgi:hypothetical protein